MSPDLVTEKYQQFLTEAEKKEIFNYKQVYYIGLTANKHRRNLGYITDYIIIINDQIAFRY